MVVAALVAATVVEVVLVVLVGVVMVVKVIHNLDILELDTPEEVVVVDHLVMVITLHQMVVMVLSLSDTLYNGII